jgi:succinoglycan biosynthesis protein ExoM
MFLRCFESLLAQRVPEGSLSLSLVVVDNSSDAGERETVAERQSGGVPVLYIHEPRAGIPVARNAALEAATTLAPDWIVFIDDDEIAPPDWIARLHACAVHYGADVTAGLVVPLETADEAHIAAQSWKAPETFGAVRVQQTSATSNVIFRSRMIMEPLSLRFDEAMRYGGSDAEFFMRASQSGARIIYVKDAAVYEEFPPERQALSYQCMRSFRVGTTTNYRYLKNLGSWRGAITVTLSALNKFVSAMLGVLIAVVAFPFSRATALRNVRRSAKAASYAIGCLGPAFGIRPNRYW